MMINPMHPQPLSRQRQQGVVLITGLIFLVVLTLLGVTAMRSAGLEEKMASNTQNTKRAEQAAESAVRYAEDWLLAQEPAPAVPSSCASAPGFCASNNNNYPDKNNWDTRSVEYGQDPDGVDAADLTFVTANPTIENDPRYLIEEGPTGSTECGTGCADPICASVYTIRAEGKSGGISAQLETQFTRCYTNYSGGACGCTSPTTKANTRTKWDLLN